MATYKLQTKNDIKFVCILDREVSKIFKLKNNLEQSNNVFEFRR